jgi:hypothetical protein
MWSYALLPGVFWSCDLFLEKRPFAFIYLIITFSLLFLTGHPVMIIYIGMVIFLYLFFQVVNSLRSGKNVLPFGPSLLALSGSVLVAVLIASPQLLPMLQLFPFSARTVDAGISLDVLQNTIHLQPIWLPLSLFPTPFYLGDEWSWANLVRVPFYALFLACIGLLFGAGRPRRGFFIFLGVFSVLMALGPYVGLWKMVHSLPILEHFRFPFRWLFFLPICVAFLSARGMDCLLNLSDENQPAGFGRILRITILTGSVAGTVFFIRYHATILELIQKTIESSLWLTGLLWFCTIGMVVAICLILIKGLARRSVVLGSAFTVISLFAGIAFSIQDPLAIRNLDKIGWSGEKPLSEPQFYRTSDAYSSWEVFFSNTLNRHYQYLPNLTVLNGALTTGHYFSFFPYWSSNVSSWCRDALDGDLKKQIYLTLGAARWLFPREGSSFDAEAFPTESYKNIKAYKNSGALPRANVVFSYRLFSGDEDLVAFLESSAFDPRRELALLSQDTQTLNLRPDVNYPQYPEVIPIEAKIVEERPDRIEMELNPIPPREAFLVLSDTYYPGWRALVDGVEVKILRANYAFRGIKLPEGSRNVVFFFDPLVPDAVLPLPAFVLATLGGAMLLRHRLIRKRSR